MRRGEEDGKVYRYRDPRYSLRKRKSVKREKDEGKGRK